MRKLLFPCGNGLINSLLAYFYVSIFHEQPQATLVAWALTGFVGGFIVAFIIQHTIKSWQKPIQHTSKYAVMVCSVLFNFLVACPFFAVLFTPFMETNRHAVCCETPLNYGAKNYESLTLNMRDGTQISGWYVAPTSHPNELIILVHGHYNDRRGVSPWAKYLIGAGYGIFMYDQRGNGESTGELHLIKDYKSQDLLEVTQQISEKYTLKKIGVIGLSMGAHTVMNAAAENQNTFNVIWVDGLMPQAESDLVNDTPTTIKLQGFLYCTIGQQLYWMEKLHSDNLPAPRGAITSILPRLTHPQVMLVSGGLEDVENAANRQYEKFNNSHVHSWIIPTGHHLSGPYDAPDEYRRRLLEFFAQGFEDTKETAAN